MVSRMTVGILRLLKREPQPRTRKARPGAVSKEQIILMMGLSAVKEGTIVPTAATALKTGQSIVACRLMSRDRPTKAAMNSSAVKATKVRKSALFAVAEETKKPQPERPREKKLKFSYNEQREFETIDAVLAELEEKLAACRRAQEACGSDYVRLQELTDEQERLSAELDEKTERWVYLNDLKEKIDAQNSQG